MNAPLSGIDVFVQVVDARSFALAAERLRLTRSAVAKTIARLENRLGTRLFHRTTRSQRLTEDGQAFYERCVRALAEIEEGAAALDSGRREPGGLLRISAPALFGRYCVAPALLSLSTNHAKLNIDASFSDRLVDLIDEGYDLAVRIGSLPDSSALASRRIGVQTMSIYAAPSYLEKNGRPNTLDELSRHRGIAYSRSGSQTHWRLHGDDGRMHEVAINTRLRLDDLQAVVDAAVAGHGLAWLPCWLVSRYLPGRELQVVFDGSRVASREIHAVWPQTRFLPAKTRAAIDILAAKVPERVASPMPGQCAWRGAASVPAKHD
jgi:DNA-binding transcriptional LysR family regulator